MKKIGFFGAAALLAAISLSGCGDGEGTVKVAFSNATGTRSAHRAVGDKETPTMFGMKMVVIYLVQDVDATTQNNVGNVARIWVNPKCDESLTNCAIGAQAGANQVTDYLDFALPTAQVNANLNSQGLKITPGTYKYIRVDFSGPNGGGDSTMPNLKFGNSTTTKEIRPNFGNGYTVAIDPPITIAKGETVTVSMAYDLENAFYTDANESAATPPTGATLDNWYCAGTGDPKTGPCLLFPGFTPSATKN